MDAELVGDAPERQTLCVAVDEKSGDTLRARTAGARKNDEHFCVAGIGDPLLRAVEDVSVAVTDGSRAQRSRVAARVRFRERKTAEPLARAHMWKVLFLL